MLFGNPDHSPAGVVDIDECSIADELVVKGAMRGRGMRTSQGNQEEMKVGRKMSKSAVIAGYNRRELNMEFSS